LYPSAISLKLFEILSFLCDFNPFSILHFYHKKQEEEEIVYFIPLIEKNEKTFPTLMKILVN